MLPIFVAALAVIAGMLVMADYARREADQARQAQAVMERTRTLGAGIDSLTWRTLATRKTEGTDAVLAEGMGSYKQLTASLRRLRALGVPRSRTAAVEQRLGEAYGQGMQALLASGATPRWVAASRSAVSLRPCAASTRPSPVSPRSRTASRARHSSVRGSGGSVR